MQCIKRNCWRKPDYHGSSCRTKGGLGKNMRPWWKLSELSEGEKWENRQTEGINRKPCGKQWEGKRCQWVPEEINRNMECKMLGLRNPNCLKEWVNKNVPGNDQYEQKRIRH